MNLDKEDCSLQEHWVPFLLTQKSNKTTEQSVKGLDQQNKVCQGWMIASCWWIAFNRSLQLDCNNVCVFVLL